MSPAKIKLKAKVFGLLRGQVIRLKLGKGNLHILQHGTTLYSPAELYFYMPFELSSMRRGQFSFCNGRGRGGLQREREVEGKEAGREGAVTCQATFSTHYR